MALPEDKDPIAITPETSPLLAPKKKKRKKKGKKKGELNKNTLNILRTTLRNNIELTGLADNKANVLLSLNAVMLTFLVPLTLPYLDRIMALNLGPPLILLAITCFVTIYLSVHVLKPGKFVGQAIKMDGTVNNVSPFFFGNFMHMQKNDFLDYSSDVLKDELLVQSYISNDFYHIGLRLAEKMKLIRTAFNIFIIGMSASIFLTILMLIIYG